MAVYNIPFHQPTLIGDESDHVLQATAAGTWTKISEECIRFFDEYYSGAPCFYTNSCTSALEVAIRSLEIGAGDEVIIPGFSYVALANAVVNSGATPVYADVTLPDGNIDVESAAACITSRTKAIIVLHYAGNSCDISALMDLSSSNNIYLIEDAAQCIGSEANHKPLGSFGHIGCLSFDYMKNVSCGQGGLLVVNDAVLVDRVQTVYDNGTNRQALSKGTDTFFDWVGKGMNSQMNPLASYFLVPQLKAIKAITESRVNKWNLYHKLLQPLAAQGRIALNKPKAEHNGHIFYLITDSAEERTDLRDHLRRNGILSEQHYSSLTTSAYGRQYASGSSLVNSEKLCKGVLRLPFWHQISVAQIEAVANCIDAFYSKR